MREESWYLIYFFGAFKMFSLPNVQCFPVWLQIHSKHIWNIFPSPGLQHFPVWVQLLSELLEIQGIIAGENTSLVQYIIVISAKFQYIFNTIFIQINSPHAGNRNIFQFHKSL